MADDHERRPTQPTGTSTREPGFATRLTSYFTLARSHWWGSRGLIRHRRRSGQRPKFEEALRTAREVKAHAPHCRVIFTVYEMKRLGRDAAELTALADHLTAHGLLEMLAGPLPGIYDCNYSHPLPSAATTACKPIQ
ncbi:hypothetical protein [Streptomyces sp900116325]|uniref:hypothetical protein n=1 Tax=Streptomyces sp. 900116325 TaxID=3154295 RepID=UPI0033F109DB